MKAQKPKTQIERMVLGVLDVSKEISDSAVAGKYRDFTISWARYDYRGEMIEADSVNEILNRATSLGHHWCLILPYGHVVAERWRPEHWHAKDFRTSLVDLVERNDFLVAGTIVGDPDHWFGFENRCLLVNLGMYNQLSSPDFNSESGQPVEVSKLERQMQQGRISQLLPTTQREVQRPSLSGWNFIAASLDGGVPVVGFDDSVLGGILDLSANRPVRTQSFANYLDQNIVNYDRNAANLDLGEDQIAFLNMVQPQTTSAPNGVFLWNIESYADVETASEDFKPPISSLYCVAAGFKPNRILQTHGFDSSTRMVYFDYSPQALKIKRYMLEHWDGEEFPDFVDQLLTEFPYPETFYQLWDELTPENVKRSDIQRMWQRELQHWGDAQIFREHWQAYVELPHEFICCNLLTDPSLLIEQIDDEPDAIIWWSNAFFTMYGNWFYTLDERKQMYERWIQQIARRNPHLYLFGSDENNVNVNSIRAGEYWDVYKSSGCSCLKPCRMSNVEMRM